MSSSKPRAPQKARSRTQAAPASAPAASPRSEGWKKCLPWLLALVCGLLSYGFLLSGQADMLFRSQELSLFLPGGQFLREQMVVPGGLATYEAAWFTQFLYYPALGIALLVVLWWAVFALSFWLFRLPRRWEASFRFFKS